MTPRMVTDAAGLLRRARNPDGGFGARGGQPSEPEPTALAALALNDDDAGAWLIERQGSDGSYSIRVGPYVNDSATALAVLALRPGAERERALDHVEAQRARRVASTDAIPIDPTVVGWGWAGRTASWVEPTARALWALREHRPSSPAVAEAVALLRDRECVGGGWNYGNRVVLDEELVPFAQTTAVALVALRDLDAELEVRGVETLRRLWRQESAGGLTLAIAVAAFRVHGDETEATAASGALRRLLDETELVGDVVALAWAALASSDRLPGAPS
jgi:hypothetical protein